MTVYANFFGGAFFNGGFFGPGIDSGGHGSAEGGADDDGAYAEPRRVIIRGKPYTVTSKAQYLGLLARGRRDHAREQADTVIARSQETAKESLQARQTAETGALLHALLEREAKKKPKAVPIESDEIPIELLMLIAANE